MIEMGTTFRALVYGAHAHAHACGGGEARRSVGGWYRAEDKGASKEKGVRWGCYCARGPHQHFQQPPTILCGPPHFSFFI